MKPPADCADMADIRTAIDALDRDLMVLMAQRAAYVDRAAQIKAGLGLAARLPARVDEVLANVAGHAAAAGLDPAPYVKIWRGLIDWSIAQEEKILGKEAGT